MEKKERTVPTVIRTNIHCITLSELFVKGYKHNKASRGEMRNCTCPSVCGRFTDPVAMTPEEITVTHLTAGSRVILGVFAKIFLLPPPQNQNSSAT